MNDSDLCSLCDAWIDHDLIDTEQINFEAHWKSCESCRRKIENWQSLELDVIAAFGLFDSDDATPISPRTEDLPAQRIGTHRKYAPWVIAATLMFAMLIGWLAWNGRGRSDGLANHPVERSDKNNSNSDSTLAQIPGISINVVEPVIATSPVTTTRFTVVNVYPVLSPYVQDAID